MQELNVGGPNSAETTQALLQIAGADLPVSLIASWTGDQRREVGDWAVAVHLRANDNDVEVPKWPDCVPEDALDWRG